MAAQAAVWGRPIPQATLYLHGTQDGCLSLDEEAIKGVAAFLGPGSTVERVSGVGHFMLLERPAEISARILRFLGQA
jgi:pimeloyl-ACP methyl ester carboxylesterase